MTILKDVLAELFSMFAGDRWLTLAVLALVGLCAVLAGAVGGEMVGAALAFGCLAILLWAVRAEAARRRAGSKGTA